MVGYVFFPKEVAITHLEALKKEASRLAEKLGLNEQEWWWNYRGDDIVFAFAKHGNGGYHVAQIFAFNFKLLPCRGEW
jgi:hypothetical protein